MFLAHVMQPEHEAELCRSLGRRAMSLDQLYYDDFAVLLGPL